MSDMGWLKQSYSKGERTSRKYLNRVFTEEGADRVDNALTKVIGEGRQVESNIKLGTAGYALGITWGTSQRVKSGESLLPALGKEMVQDARYALFPELMVGEMARLGAKVYPQVNEMAERKKSNIMNYNTMGGGYQDTKANYASRARSLEMIKRTKMPMMGGEARRYHS